MKQVSGGVCAAKGFVAAGVHCGVKASSSPDKNDLALILSEKECTAAATYTLNRVTAAPLYVTMDHLENGVAWGVVANSGNANACCPMSHEYAEEMARLAARATGRAPADFVVASTGVIGQRLPVDKVLQGIREIIPAKLAKENGSEAAYAIMTTDTVRKECAYELQLSTGTVKIGAMAKGSGMIHPNMATMLVYVTTDAKADPADLQKMLSAAVDKSFNMCTVDGDTSTNDTLYGLANGASGVPASGGEAIKALSAALTSVLGDLAYMLVKDGEGASKVARIHVAGAASDADAERVARTVGHSQLVKTALYGRDANWGRIVAAVGRSGADFNPDDVVVTLCGVELFRKGQPTDLDFDALLEEPLKQRDLPIDIVLGSGSGSYTLLASDLGHEYVNVNADYRS